LGRPVCGAHHDAERTGRTGDAHQSIQHPHRRSCLNGGTIGVLGSSNFSPTFNSHISEVKVGLNYKFPSGFLFW